MKRTPLHEWHTANGALMREFGGYDMPLWYPAGAKEEHLAVLTGAGIFDTSHMSVITVRGAGSFDLLQRHFSRDIAGLAGRNGNGSALPAKCGYGVFLNQAGGVIDDAVVYPVGPDNYLLVVNAGMGEVIRGHLESHSGPRPVEIIDRTGKVGKIDLQGPRSARILEKLLPDPVAVFAQMDYFTFRGGFDPSFPHYGEVRLKNGASLLLSRTGYTGEFGFELFMDADLVRPVWEMILEAGESHALIPCGLAARDSLRAGAMLPLSHQDIGNWRFVRNPWRFALPYSPDRKRFTKDFTGRDALEDASGADYTYPFLGYDVRKVSASDEVPAGVIDDSGKVIGKVLTCVTEMGVGRRGNRVFSITSPDKPEGFVPGGLSCGFIRVSLPLSPGSMVTLRDSRRSIPVTIVTDIRPDRSARNPIHEMLAVNEYEEKLP